MSGELTDAGLSIDRQEDIRTAMEEDIRSALGAGIKLDARSPLGQIVGLDSFDLSLIYELIEDIYYSQYPETATGSSLDLVCAFNNISRKPATYSTGTILLTGTAGTVVPAGFIASVSGDPLARFVTTQDGTVGLAGTVTIPVRAESTGETIAYSGSLTVIETPVTGIDSCTNASDATVGQAIETDDALRARRAVELQRSGTATVEGIRNALLNILNVVQSLVIENDTDEEDEDGRPPHSFESIVLGGADADIAQCIWESKPAGIQTTGTVDVTVIDSQGFSHVISFSRPTPVEVWLEVDIVPNADASEGEVYPADGDDQVEAAILAWAASLEIGRDLILSQMYTPINTVPGVNGITIRAGLTEHPTGVSNLTIAPGDIAELDSARILMSHGT